jgi:hypothetical protein
MDFSGWSDEAVAAAASATGAVAAIARSGREPTAGEAVSLMQAAGAELARRGKVRRPAKRGAPAPDGRAPGAPRILGELLEDPVVLGALAMLAALLAAVARPWPRARLVGPPSIDATELEDGEPPFPVADSYLDYQDYIDAVADWMADPAVMARTTETARQSYGLLADEMTGTEAAWRRRRASQPRVRLADLSEYVEWQSAPKGEESDASLDLPQTLVAWANCSKPHDIRDLLRQAAAARGAQAISLILSAAARVGDECLLMWPGSGWPRRGKPSGKWPLPPAAPPVPATAPALTGTAARE